MHIDGYDEHRDESRDHTARNMSYLQLNFLRISLVAWYINIHAREDDIKTPLFHTAL